MIVYWLNYTVSSGGKITSRPRCDMHTGQIVTVGNELWLLREDGKSVFLRKRKWTMFDDSVQPPRLLREDYRIKDLRKLKAKLPLCYTDRAGDIVETASGKILMEGPKQKEQPV